MYNVYTIYITMKCFSIIFFHIHISENYYYYKKKKNDFILNTNDVEKLVHFLITDLEMIQLPNSAFKEQIKLS